MHAGWRLYIRLLRVCAVALFGLRQSSVVLDDPPVRSYNSSIYFLWRMTRAVSEYLLYISQTAGGVDIDLPVEFGEAAAANIDLNWLFHFVYDYAYMVLEFKQSVRSGDSSKLDLLWREFFATGRTSTANKTHYIPMSIMRIFWANALHPDLARLYESMRSIPMSKREGSMVGWDCVVEWLNAAITEGVAHSVSEERIEEFIHMFPLLQENYTVLRAWLSHSAADEHTAFMKDMDKDVAKLKGFFIDKVGHDWATATRANSVSHLGISTRSKTPWAEVKE
eukprot:6185805-Pleurochrysis_carterae.AAC.1